MTETSTSNRRSEKTSAEAIEQLTSVFAAYNETAGRVDRAHRQLQTEIVRLREEIRQKNEQLQRKSRLAALGEMAAGMAHEIRNPLAAVQLYVSLLQHDLADRQNESKWVRKIDNAVHKLDMIVTDILAFTQDQPCEKTEVHLPGLLAEVADYVRPQLDADNVQIDFSQVDRHLKVHVDVNMIERVLLNLLRNAVEAAGSGGRVAIIAQRYTNRPNFTVRIRITDTGPGIEPAVMTKIFNPFFTTKDAGIGLGLAIVHRLVECHGGIISAANNENRGAAFTILLP